MKKTSPLLVFFLALFGSLFAAPAPDFTVTTSEGTVRKLYQDYVNQNKILVVEMFFIDCPPCNTHAPYWKTLYQQMKAAYPGQVEFMILSVKTGDTNAEVAQYKTSKSLDMPGAGNDGGSVTALTPYMNSQFGDYLGTPTFFVIAPGTGEVTFDIRGSSPQNTMDKIAQKISELSIQSCTLKTPFNNPIADVKLKIVGTGYNKTLTASGSYTLDTITQLQNIAYTITPSKTDVPLTGLSTFDLVLMYKHILNIEPFTQSWQVTAGDLNDSGSLTTFDIVSARKVILGLTDTFPNGKSWIFLAQPPGSTSNGQCLNFQGIKLGDISGPYFAPEGAESRSPVLLHAEDLHVEAGETYLLPFYSPDRRGMNGMQFRWTSKELSFENLEAPELPDFSDEAYFIAGGSKLSLAWASAETAHPDPSRPLFVLHFRALVSGKLSDMLFMEGIGGEIPSSHDDHEIRRLETVWTGKSEAPAVYPNPGSGIFTFIGTRPERIRIMNAQGVRVAEKECLQGGCTFDISSRPPGPYFFDTDGGHQGVILLQKK